MTTRQVLRLLEAYESRNVTYIDPEGDWPIVWERARGVHVWDAEGRRYLDLTAAFGVAAAGHANPAVVRAGREQMGRLLHAMGDVHPHELKARLARELSRLTFERWALSGVEPRNAGNRRGKSIFCNSGFEAVEAALKTAHLATRKPGIIAFEGGYHGLGYGALNATHRIEFRGPFRPQLREFGHFVPFPDDAIPSTLDAARAAVELRLAKGGIGAVLIEPIQARGGIRVVPTQFLVWLRETCTREGVLLVFDEIYTGFGRTGKWFASEHARVTPDLICLGKALTGGFPLSVCVGLADLMDSAWPTSTGEAIHTSTFLGHPVGCAMALAQIRELRRRRLCEHSARLGHWLRGKLSGLVPSDGRLTAISCGLGLMLGLELRQSDGSPATQAVVSATKQMLKRGYIVLPEGEHSNVLGLTPPLTITQPQLEGAIEALAEVLRALVPRDRSRNRSPELAAGARPVDGGGPAW